MPVKLLDPASRLNNPSSMRPEELAFVTMEARNAAEGILNRYKSKGGLFMQLVARHLVDTIQKRTPAKPQAPTYGDDVDGSLF